MSEGEQMGRKRVTERKTTIAINEGLSGWIEFRGRTYGRGASEYLNDLAERDREAALSEGGEVAERYRAYLRAIDREGELESVGVKEG